MQNISKLLISSFLVKSMEILWPLTCSFISLHLSDPLQQASSQQKFKALSHPWTRQNHQPCGFQWVGAARGNGGNRRKTAASLWNARHPTAGSETAKSAAVKPNPHWQEGEKQRESWGGNSGDFPLATMKFESKDTNYFWAAWTLSRSWGLCACRSSEEAARALGGS